MKKYKYCLWLALIFLLPLIAFSQNGNVPWPANEDTMWIPATTNVGGLSLTQFIAQDTAGLGWKGADGVTAWANHTRVYVLQPNTIYFWGTSPTITSYNKKLMIRGAYKSEFAGHGYDGYKKFDANGISWLPIIQLENVGSSASTSGINVNNIGDTVIFKHVAISGYDETDDAYINHLDKASPTLVTIGGNNTNGAVYIDSCAFEAFTSAVICSTKTGTVRIQNSILGDAGTLANSNFGAGRIIDGRTGNVPIDTIDINNCTIFNVVDRVVRRLQMTAPLHTFFFNHNTVFNCISYHGFLTVGAIDSSAAGHFEVRNNLFVDNFAFGPDTDALRQVEFSDSPDLDPNNSAPKMSWLVATKTPTSGQQKWTIDHNYYCISDSGKAIRNFVSSHHPILYRPLTDAEPFMTSDIQTQLVANGGTVASAFTLVNKVQFNFVHPVMSKLAHFYMRDTTHTGSTYITVGNTVGASDSTNGAGEEKIKSTSKPIAFFGPNGTSYGGGSPLTQFASNLQQFERWPYDYKRMRLDSILDKLDAGYKATTNLAAASSDGKIIGSNFWSFGGLLTDVSPLSKSNVPAKFALSQNFPNPFNPTTTINYTLSKSMQVSLKVYDVLGREVATLVNGMQEVGQRTAVWDASHVASGVYFYKLVAGDFSDVKRMILLK